MTKSRRDFLAVLGAGAGAAAGCLSDNEVPQVTNEDPEPSDSSADSGGPPIDVEERWVPQRLPEETLDTADRIIGSLDELEALPEDEPESQLVVISQPETPYEITRWIDLTVSGVSIVGEFPFAEDAEPLLRVADGANVGGVRFPDDGQTDLPSGILATMVITKRRIRMRPT